MHHLLAFVLGRVLPKEICEVHCPLDHQKVQAKARVGCHQRFGPTAEHLFVGVKGSAVLGERHVSENSKWRHSRLSFLWYDLWYDLNILLILLIYLWTPPQWRSLQPPPLDQGRLIRGAQAERVERAGLMVVAHTPRDGRTRLISSRPACRKEREANLSRYAKCSSPAPVSLP